MKSDNRKNQGGHLRMKNEKEPILFLHTSVANKDRKFVIVINADFPIRESMRQKAHLLPKSKNQIRSKTIMLHTLQFKKNYQVKGENAGFQLYPTK